MTVHMWTHVLHLSDDIAFTVMDATIVFYLVQLTYVEKCLFVY
jgi:hypothetical protein